MFATKPLSYILIAIEAVRRHMDDHHLVDMFVYTLCVLLCAMDLYLGKSKPHLFCFVTRE